MNSVIYPYLSKFAKKRKKKYGKVISVSAMGMLKVSKEIIKTGELPCY